MFNFLYQQEGKASVDVAAAAAVTAAVVVVCVETGSASRYPFNCHRVCCMWTKRTDGRTGKAFVIAS